MNTPPQILVVEDDAVLAIELQQTLTQLGYQVVGLAATGKEAVELALAQKPDLLLMDIRLRGAMTGIQAVEQIHQQRDIPVVYLTAFTDEALLQQAKITDAYAYLIKPVRERELRAGLEMALYKHSTEKHLQHLNQILRAVREVNQLITREHDTQRLLDQACQVLLRTHGYRFVWIGQAAGDRLKPLAHAGDGEALIKLIAASATSEQGLKLPGTQAARTRHVVVCYDMLHDERYASWRDEIEQVHFFSTVAVPIFHEESLFGVLSVYSDQTNIFGTEELDLLNELTGDIAFGLKVIDRESERQIAAESLRASEARYRELFNNASLAIFQSTLEGGVLAVNPEFARIFGFASPAEVVNTVKSAGDIFADPKRRGEIIHLIAENPALCEFESLYQRKDGSTFLGKLNVRQILDANGRPLYFEGFIEDITKQRRAEAALRESEQKLRLLFETMSQGVISYDAQGKIISANRAAERILGFSLDQLLGNTFVNTAWTLIRENGSELPAEDHPVAITLRTGKPIEHYVLGLFNPNMNAHTWLSVTTVPVFNQDGKTLSQVYSTFENITERKRAERALKLSEEKFAKAFRMNPSVIILAQTRDARVIEINDTFTKVFGYTRDEIIDSTTLEKGLWVDPQDRARLLMQLTKKVVLNNIEVLFRTKDGRVIICSSSFEMLEIEGEQHILSVLEDITERKRAENALRESEAKFRAVVENSNDGIIFGDANARILYRSPSYNRINGFTDEERVGHSGFETVHPDDIEALQRYWAKIIKHPEISHRTEYRIRHKDGTWRWIETTGQNLLGNTDVHSVVVTSRDISERKWAESALIESEARYRGAIEAAGLVPYVLDYNSKCFTFIGENIIKLTGYSANEITPALLQESILESKDWAFDSSGRQLDEAQNKFLTAEPGHKGIDMRIRTSSGQERWLSDASVPLPDEHGRLTKAIGIIQDLTERKRAEEDRIAREIAEQANRAKSEFLSRMSHELRTPLNAILGFAQLLKMDELRSDQKKGVEQIYKSGRHLLNLVNEVLDIARIESGKLHISPEPVCLADAVQEALDLIRPLAEERHLSLSLKLPATPNVFVIADHQSLRQVLLNLLSNAVKYNREAGEVAVTTSLTIDGHLRLQVRDSGEGIPPDKMKRLFVPFDRLDRDSIEQEGTGLGLALSKGLVESLGGRMGASSQLGVGSIFWLELKLANERLTEAILAEVNEHISARMRTWSGVVLYVEDNLDNLKLVEAIMERMPQIKLINAMQGRLALDLAQEHHPDLILLDLHLPDMPGSEVLRRLKAEPATQKTPVIILSADAIPEHITDLMAGGAYAYLTKPIDIQGFLNVVSEFLVEAT